MRKIYMVLIGLLFAVGCSPQGPAEKTLTIVNAAAIDAELLEGVRAFAEKELRVPVRLIEKPELAGSATTQALKQAALRKKHENDVAYIVVAEEDEEEHLTVDAEAGVAIINARALFIDNADLFEGRIRRMVMRAAAFSFGLEPTPDPFCVTRDYRSLEELDRMGNNYSPPWQVRFAEAAAQRGLQPVQPAAAPGPGTP